MRRVRRFDGRSTGRVVAKALAIAILLLPATFQLAQTRLKQSCSDLASLHLPDTVVTSAATVQTGRFTPPPPGRTLDALPPFCRVTATTKPAIKFEVWMPLRDWNGKFQGVGNGGTAGMISYRAMA